MERKKNSGPDLQVEPPNMEGKTHLIILIPGFLTRSENQFKTKGFLEERIQGSKVVLATYGYFDLVRFLLPGKLGKKSSIERVKKKIQNAVEKIKPVKTAVIAHSFGSYILSKIFEDDDNIKFDTVVLCGAIFHKDFNWDRFLHRIGIIVNDCGIKDPWPVLAVSVGAGYGSTGRFGVGGLVNDRFHDFGHSGFWSSRFINDYWVPLLENDTVKPGRRDLTPSAWWISIPEFLNIWWIAIAAATLGAAAWLLMLRLEPVPPLPCEQTASCEEKLPNIIASISLNGIRVERDRVSEEHRATYHFNGRNSTQSQPMSPGEGWAWDLSVSPRHSQGPGESAECVPPSLSNATEQSIVLSAHLRQVWDFPHYEDAHQQCTLIATRYRYVERERTYEIGPLQLRRDADLEVSLPAGHVNFTAVARTYSGQVIPFGETGVNAELLSATVTNDLLVVSPKPR